MLEVLTRPAPIKKFETPVSTDTLSSPIIDFTTAPDNQRMKKIAIADTNIRALGAGNFGMSEKLLEAAQQAVSDAIDDGIVSEDGNLRQHQLETYRKFFPDRHAAEHPFGWVPLWVPEPRLSSKPSSEPTTVFEASDAAGA